MFSLIYECPRASVDVGLFFAEKSISKPNMCCKSDYVEKLLIHHEAKYIHIVIIFKSNTSKEIFFKLLSPKIVAVIGSSVPKL